MARFSPKNVFASIGRRLSEGVVFPNLERPTLGGHTANMGPLTGSPPRERSTSMPAALGAAYGAPQVWQTTNAGSENSDVYAAFARADRLGRRQVPYVYVASKLNHAPMLRKLWTVRNDVKFTSRWVFLEGQVPDDLCNAEGFWADDVSDVLDSDALIMFAEPGENLRGALFEAGLFYSKNGGPIYVVDAQGKPKAGASPDQITRPNYGTFPALPGFYYVPSIEAALDDILSRHTRIMKV